MWITAQLKKIEEAPLCVTLWFVEHDGKIDPLCVMRTHAVEVRCSDFDFGRYETTIGELFKNLSPFVLLNREWAYDDYCNLAVDVDAGVFMTILPLDERKKRLNSIYGVSNTAYMFCREPDATIFAYGLGKFYKLTYQTTCGLRSCNYKHDDEVKIIDRVNHRREAAVTFVDLLNGIPGKTYTDSVYTKITDAEVKYCIADLTVLGISVYLSGDIFDQVIAAAKRRKEILGYIDTDSVRERLTFGPGKIYVGTPDALVGVVPEAIRRAIENEEEQKMDDQFSMAIRSIRSYSAGHYPWKSSNDESVVPKIKKVYFNKPVTVVLWEDGTKTVVKCQPGERYDSEKGLAMAISKKALGNTSKWYNTLKKELDNAPKPKKRSSARKEATDEKA